MMRKKIGKSGRIGQLGRDWSRLCSTKLVSTQMMFSLNAAWRWILKLSSGLPMALERGSLGMPGADLAGIGPRITSELLGHLSFRLCQRPFAPLNAGPCNPVAFFFPNDILHCCCCARSRASLYGNRGCEGGVMETGFLHCFKLALCEFLFLTFLF